MLSSVEAELRVTGGEIIVVDDGSTDGSSETLSGLAAADMPIRVISQPNAGVAAATNRLIAEARYPFSRLVDGDDTICPGSTVRLRAVLNQTGAGFAYGCYSHVECGVTRHSAPELVIDPLKLMLKTQPFVPSVTLCRTTTLKRAAPLPDDIRTSQDFSLGLRLAALTPFAAIDDVCAIMPVASMGLSADKAGMYRDSIRLASMFAREQSWPVDVRIRALSRASGRARNYLRRHARCSRTGIIAVSLMAIVTKLRIPLPFYSCMAYIAGLYKEGE